MAPTDADETDEQRPQRLVFGSVAAAYDAHRPSYPASLFDSILARTVPDPSALDVGAGTGRVAIELARRSVTGIAVEPDPEMAAVARTRLPAASWDVTIGDFEHVDLGDRRFDAVTCGQAWHWVDHDRGLRRACDALRPGGVLAIFWNRPDFSTAASLRADLDTVYRRLEPGLVDSVGRKGDPLVDRPAPGFVDAVSEEHEQFVEYTADGWVALLGTHSNHIQLPERRRRRLHDAVHATIEAHGGRFELRYRCEAWVAKRVHRA